VEPALKRLGGGRGRYEVPVMLGSNRDEIKLFFSQDPEFISRYLNIFVRVRDEYRYETLSRFHSDMWKVNGVDDPAMALRSAQSPGVYAYRFDWDEEPVVLGADISLILGASHGLEIPFVFGRFRFGEQRMTDLIFNSENFPGRKYVSDAMMSYWAEFAYTGTPGRGRARSLPEWEPWPEGDEGRFIVFDTPSSGGIRMEAGRLTRADVISAVDAEASLPQSEKCKIFWNLFRFSETWSEDAWRDMGRGGCRDVDIAEMNLE
jgi:para-nitrobenzyl esterase